MGCRLNYPTMACDSPASNVSIESKLLGYSLLYWQYARTDLDEILAVPSFIVRVVETIMVCSLSCSKFQVSCTLRMAILKLCLPVVGFFRGEDSNCNYIVAKKRISGLLLLRS